MDIDLDKEIIRHDDGTLVVTFAAQRAHDDDEAPAVGETRTLHPGEGDYDDALAAWDLQHHPDRPAAVSTASGRDQAMSAVHAAGSSDEPDVDQVLATLEDREATAEALRHVLVGGEPSVAAFAAEIAEAHGDEPLPSHAVAKTIGNLLAKLEA